MIEKSDESLRVDGDSAPTALWREIPEAAEQWGTLLALLAAGTWAYFRFVKGRSQHPAADIDIRADHRRITDNATLLHVALSVTNRGSVLLEGGRSVVRIDLVIPPREEITNAIESKVGPPKVGTQIKWDFLDHKEKTDRMTLEPNETDEVFFDFVIRHEYRTVRIYAFIEDSQKTRKREDQEKPIGWRTDRMYDLTD